MMFCDRNEKRMVENAERPERRGRVFCPLYANVGEQIKEGRHIGLDFYDLLIEALMGAVPTWAGATYRKQADVQISVCKDGGTVFGFWFLLESVYEGGRRFTVVFAQHPFDAVLQI